MRSRIRSGVSGCEVIETPSGASASRTAFTNAAGEPIAPPSPRPLWPPGVSPGGPVLPVPRARHLGGGGQQVVHERSRGRVARLVVPEVLVEHPADTLHH